ncbi:MAG: hypothetical protein AAF687_09420 [Pseudomonadota bacterium]
MMKKVALALVALTMVSTPAHAGPFWGKKHMGSDVNPRFGPAHVEYCNYRFWIKVSCTCTLPNGEVRKGPCGGIVKPTKPPREEKADAKQQNQRATPAIKKGPALKPG